MSIHRLLLNQIHTNCFIVERDKDALLVDPTDEAGTILNYIKCSGLTLRYMLATHGHFDHVRGAAGVIDSGLVDKLYVHKADFIEVKRGSSYSMMLFKRPMHQPRVTMFDEEIGEFLATWGLGLQHVGGHTKGSCYLYDLERKFIITGDLLLHHKLNITIFDSREDRDQLCSFIQSVTADFSPETVLFPGHGDCSTLGEEMEKNAKWAYVLQKERAEARTVNSIEMHL